VTNPYWYNNKTYPTSNVTYSPGTTYWFNVTCNDNIGINNAWLVINGTLYYMQNQSNEFYITINDLSAGTYEYNFTCNDTSGNTNTSSTFTYVIQKAKNPIELYINGNLNQNITTVEGTINITGRSIHLNSGYIYIFVNGTELENGTDVVTNVSTFSKGTYEIKVNSTGNQNYTSNSTGLTYYLFIKLANGKSCSANQDCYGGYCVHGICRSSSTYCGDGYCDSGEDCSSCSKDCGTCPIASASPYVYVQTHPGKGIVYMSFIKENKQTSLEFEKIRDLNVFEISLNVKNRKNSVKITINKLDKTPVDIKPPNTVYRYLNFSVENLDDEDINQATIKFFVEKSWISSNNVSALTISLYRYVGGKWTKLPTSYLSEDSEFVYFEATTPGFSYFAISGEKIKPSSPTPQSTCPECPSPTDWSECENGKQTRTVYVCGPETNYTCKSSLEERSCKVTTVVTKPTIPSPVVIAIMLVVIGIFSYVVFVKK